ncbi:hypothetical protein EON63_22720, partial [archaeon]
MSIGKIHHTPYTIHHIPYTIHHTPYTIYRMPYTIYHTPYTIHHTPYTIHHTPYTIYHTTYTSYRLCRFELLYSRHYVDYEDLVCIICHIYGPLVYDKYEAYIHALHHLCYGVDIHTS